MPLNSVRVAFEVTRPGPPVRKATGAIFWARVPAIRKDALDERKHASRPTQQVEGSITVLNVSRVHDDAQQGVDQDVPLATFDLLARVVVRWIGQSPLFRAPLAVCKSMIAAVGLAPRPLFAHRNVKRVMRSKQSGQSRPAGHRWRSPLPRRWPLCTRQCRGARTSLSRLGRRQQALQKVVPNFPPTEFLLTSNPLGVRESTQFSHIRRLVGFAASRKTIPSIALATCNKILLGKPRVGGCGRIELAQGSRKLAHSGCDRVNPTRIASRERRDSSFQQGMVCARGSNRCPSASALAHLRRLLKLPSCWQTYCLTDQSLELLAFMNTYCAAAVPERRKHYFARAA